jgi:hypothetical protein
MMAKDDIDRIYEELRIIRGKLEDMLVHGCAKAPQHEDLEARVRVLEAVRQKQVGFLAAASLAGSAVTALAIWAGKIIISTMAGRGGTQ